MGILQAKTLEWVAMPSSRVSSQGIKPRTPALQADSLPTEPPGKPKSKEWVAWWAAVYGVTQSRTRLKRLSSSSLSLLQRIFPTQESNQGLLHCRWILYQLSSQIRSVAQSCPTLCDPMNRSTPGLPVPGKPSKRCKALFIK